MTLDEAIQEPSIVKVEVFNPETPFGGVQVSGVADQPIQVEINTGSPVSSVFGRVGDIQPLCTDYDECYVPRTGTELPDSGATDRGIQQLVAGQNYVDVTFLAVQPDASWLLVEYVILNTTDVSPLNIWPGLITVKSETGFRIQLNGMPDSGNYYLHWAISGFVSEPFPATNYLLSGSSTSDGTDVTFTVSLPPGGTVDTPVTVTPDDSGGGGVFTPTTVVLSTTNHTRTFIYTPSSYGMKSISVTNDSSLSDPAPLAHEVIPGTYTLSGPSSGSIGTASTNFTVALPVGGATPSTITVTPGDSSGGGTFTPTTVNLTTAAPSATFIYTPATSGSKTISVTNSHGLTNPANLSYSVVAPIYTLSGPSTGSVGVASTNFTVALAVSPPISGTVVVTPSDSAGGGTFTPTTVSVTTAAPTATFTYTPATTGSKTVSVTNNRGLTNPGNLTYASVTPPHLLERLTSYWKLDETSTAVAAVQRNDSHGTNHLTEEVAYTPSIAGKINNGLNFTGTAKNLFCLDNASLRTAGSFTWAAWVRPDAAVDGIIVAKSAAGAGEYLLWYKGSGVGFYIDATPTDIASVGSTVTLGTWHHVVAWWDASDSKFHIRVNDATTYSSVTRATPLVATGPFGVGAAAGGSGTAPFAGIIDEIGFWKRVLDASEITALYNAGSGLPYGSFTTGTVTNYDLTGPTGGAVSSPSTNFTVAYPSGTTLSGTTVVTPSDGGGGGTFTPTSVNLTTAAPSATFTYTPATTGAKTISVTNDRGLTNPASLTYTAAAAPHLLNTLVAYWKLDEASTASGFVQRNDTVGTRHFTEVTAYAPSTTGKINNALNGLGAGGYLTTPNHADLQVTGDFTFSCWVKVTNFQGTMTIFSKGDYTFRVNQTTVPPSTGTGFEFSISTGPIAKKGSQYTSTPPWAHVVCWYDSSDQKIRMRIDDTTTYVSPTSAALPSPGTAVLALCGTTGGGETFNGAVDEWGFWKRLLTSAEITALYNGGAGLPYSSFTA